MGNWERMRHVYILVKVKMSPTCPEMELQYEGGGPAGLGIQGVGISPALANTMLEIPCWMAEPLPAMA